MEHILKRKARGHWRFFKSWECKWLQPSRNKLFGWKGYWGNLVLAEDGESPTKTRNHKLSITGVFRAMLPTYAGPKKPLRKHLIWRSRIGNNLYVTSRYIKNQYWSRPYRIPNISKIKTHRETKCREKTQVDAIDN